MLKKIKEGKAEISIFEDKKISKDLPVFYNPDMELNRNITLAVIESKKQKNMQIALPLAGSGVRGIRLLKEVKPENIGKVFFNDASEKACELIRSNLEGNQIKEKFEISNQDANLFLMEGKGFDYIDIDPFGSPTKFLEMASNKISRGGILGITATDTAALSGSYPKTCLRKYWSKPLRNYLKHEIGLRILLRRAQLSGATYDKAFIPLVSYSKDHYMRIFLLCKKGKTRTDEILKKHKYLIFCTKCTRSFFSDNNEHECCDKRCAVAGPMWAGKLSEKQFLKKILSQEINHKKTKEFIGLLEEESDFDDTPYHDIHSTAKILKTSVPKNETIFENIKSSRTHLNPHGFRTHERFEKILKLFKEQQ